jgi:polysaccharide biosynthesis transport protein
MAEITEEQKSEGPDIGRYLDLVRRRHLHFLIPLLVGWLIVWGASWVVQPRYKSTTLILVEQPTMPKDYVQPNVSDNLQDRLQSITQQILSRTRLLLIINKLNLYSGARKTLSPDEKIEGMRKDIDIELVRDARNDEITAFRIFYSARDPHVAQQVTRELTDLFVNENLKVRQEASESTTKFIEGQLEDARASLSAQEEKVKQFQSTHSGELPTQQASNLQILSGLQSQLQSEQDALNTARQQRVYLQALLEQNSASRVTPRAGSTAASGLASIDAELSRLRAQLTELSSRYTDRYPAVQSVKAQIAKTEQTRERLLADSKQRSNDALNSSSGGLASNAEGTQPSTSTMELQGQLQANKLEVANREHAIDELKVRINEYQARLNAEPATEQQLADLTRGYDQSKANYDDLLKKKNASAMATSMEQMQQGERFTMLDPPSLPTKPDFPKRMRFCGIGLAVGLGLGIVVVAAFEYFDDRLYSEKEIKALLTVGVIAEIPEVSNISDEQIGKRRMVLGWATAALVVCSILAGSAFSLLHQ